MPDARRAPLEFSIMDKVDYFVLKVYTLINKGTPFCYKWYTLFIIFFIFLHKIKVHIFILKGIQYNTKF